MKKKSIIETIFEYQTIFDKKKKKLPLTEEEKEIYNKYIDIVIQEPKKQKENE